MKDGKKIILTMLVIIFIIISILVLLFSNRENDPNSSGLNNNGNNNSGTINGNTGTGNNNGGSGSTNNGSNSNDPGINNGGSNDTSFYQVDNYNEFFSIQNSINKQIDYNTSFIVKEIYVNKSKENNYYFVNGSLFVNDVGEETVDYTKSLNYLLIVDTSNNNYELTKINEDISNFENYAKKYDVKDKEINSNSKLQSSNTSTEKIISTYIEYFKYMLVLDTELAYDMLEDGTKENYVDYNDFYNQVPDIYNKLISRLFSYNKKEENDKIIYSAEDNNRNKIKIYENNIMDFKISY